MKLLTKLLIFYSVFILLIFQSCQEEELIVEPEVVQIPLEQKVLAAKKWFDKGRIETLNAKERKKVIEPQWNLAKQTEVSPGKDIVVVPVFQTGSLHNNVQLISFHQNGEVSTGFILEIIPDSLQREKMELEVDSDFQGKMKLFDKEGRLIKIFEFEKGNPVNGRISGKPDVDIKGMSTLRTTSDEDPIYECGCVLQEVVIYASSTTSSSSTGYGFVYVSSPESYFSSGTGGDLGGGSGGSGGSGGPSGGGAGTYYFPIPVAPIPTVFSTQEQMTYILGQVYNSRTALFVYKVRDLLNKKLLTSTEIKSVGHLVQSVYIEVVSESYFGNSDSDIVSDLIDWQASKLNIPLQKKLGAVVSTVSSASINLQGSTQAVKVNLGGSATSMSSNLKSMLRYAFLNEMKVPGATGTLYTNNFFNFTNAHLNFSYTGSPIPNWQGTFDGVKVFITTQNLKFTEIELYFPGNPSDKRNTFADGVITKTITGVTIPDPFQIRMIGQASNGSFYTIASFRFNSGTLFYSWYKKYRTGN